MSCEFYDKCVVIQFREPSGGIKSVLWMNLRQDASCKIRECGQFTELNRHMYVFTVTRSFFESPIPLKDFRCYLFSHFFRKILSVCCCDAFCLLIEPLEFNQLCNIRLSRLVGTLVTRTSGPHGSMFILLVRQRLNRYYFSLYGWWHNQITMYHDTHKPINMKRDTPQSTS